ncbi:hypothetical protein [Solilutibacter silvestris]|uniref:Uncharacterized protein n=1 Tax=Solilutibacter silvestris TaxID=1645665 RepID=A0A2K1PYH6_9GAMM|nr:hypothetical protein [Lysobacter silvestris]PNS07829.1 hypothetical protein Lysil_2005 [Lysobacter silvestris]
MSLNTNQTRVYSLKLAGDEDPILRVALPKDTPRNYRAPLMLLRWYQDLQVELEMCFPGEPSVYDHLKKSLLVMLRVVRHEVHGWAPESVHEEVCRNDLLGRLDGVLGRDESAEEQS